MWGGGGGGEEGDRDYKITNIFWHHYLKFLKKTRFFYEVVFKKSVLS